MESASKLEGCKGKLVAIANSFPEKLDALFDVLTPLAPSTPAAVIIAFFVPFPLAAKAATTPDIRLIVAVVPVTPRTTTIFVVIQAKDLVRVSSQDHFVVIGMRLDAAKG